MKGNRFPPMQEIYLDFRSSSSHLPESNECFMNNFHVFHWKIMKMGDSSHGRSILIFWAVPSHLPNQLNVFRTTFMHSIGKWWRWAIHLFIFKKSGFDAEKIIKHEILSISSDTRVLSNIWKNYYLSRYLSYWKDERDKSSRLFSKSI